MKSHRSVQTAAEIERQDQQLQDLRLIRGAVINTIRLKRDQLKLCGPHSRASETVQDNAVERLRNARRHLERLIDDAGSLAVGFKDQIPVVP